MGKLVSRSPVPLYYQVREIIKDKIVSGEWEYGTETPSELKLCEEFNLCRGTVKQALDGLVDEGYIVRKKGKGSFVVYKKLTTNFMIEPNLERNNKGEKKGIKDYSIVLNAEVIDAEGLVIKMLGITSYHKVCKIERIHYVDDIPVAIDTHYIKNSWAGNILNENLKELAIYKYIENTFETNFRGYKTQMQSVILNEFEMSQFKFPTINCGMLIECVSEIEDEKIMYNKRVYRGDKCIINWEVAINNQKMEVVNTEVSLE